MKALEKQGTCFKYIAKKLPNLNAEKVKEGMFVGSQILWLITDEPFQITINEIERNAWKSFEKVVLNYLGKRKSPNHESIVGKILKIFQKLCCRMSVNIHYVHSHLHFFLQI